LLVILFAGPWRDSAYPTSDLGTQLNHGPVDAREADFDELVCSGVAKHQYVVVAVLTWSVLADMYVVTPYW